MIAGGAYWMLALVIAVVCWTLVAFDLTAPDDDDDADR